MKRIDAIDFTRGLVMIIMALDHTRDFMHVSSLAQSPTDLTTTTPFLFFTRWITHLCAPTFVFLSGTSAFLLFKKEGFTKTKAFLLSRGIWLLVLEFTVVNLALWFDLRFRGLFFEVIGAIGFGFIVLALMLKLPPRVIGVIGLAIIFGHGLLQYVSVDGLPPVFRTIVSALFRQTAFQVTPQFNFVVAYPAIPWLGVMLSGFAAGQLFEQERSKRKKTFLTIGLAAIALFITLRLLNIYGDPVKWSVHRTPLFTFLSFMNVSKYPPSLLFCLITLGIMFLVLYFADGVQNAFTGVVTVYGKVPLFYFLIHLYILHAIMLLMVFLQGFPWSSLIFGSFNFGRPKSGSGVGLGVIYLVWMGVVVLLFPLCSRYGSYKATHHEIRWLRYL